MSESNLILKAENLVLNIKSSAAGATARYNLQVTYDFEIYGGDFVIVHGKNGSGKSTLFKAISQNENNYFDMDGLLVYNDPENGFNNAEIANLSENDKAKLRRSIVYIGQEDEFDSWASAYDAVYNSCARAVKNRDDYTKEQKMQKYKELAAAIDKYFNNYLKPIFSDRDNRVNPYKQFKRKRVTSLSGGQRKFMHVLAGVIKAEICGCKLIILDEPLNNLDGENKFIINRMFKDMVNDESNKDIAVLVITHCQIFENINKVLSIATGENGVNKCTMAPLENYVCHSDCLNDFKNCPLNDATD